MRAAGFGQNQIKIDSTALNRRISGSTNSIGQPLILIKPRPRLQLLLKPVLAGGRGLELFKSSLVKEGFHIVKANQIEDIAVVNNEKQQKVIVTNKHGEKLVGLLHETCSPQIVILCHGFRSSKDNNIMTSLAQALQNEGISAFRFDFAGNGESEGSFEYGNYWREADDLHAVIQHFKSVNRVISVILGHSKGGGVVLLYAAKYQDVPAVVNVSGRYDLKIGVEDRLGKEYLQKIKEVGFIDVKNKTGSVEYRVTADSLMDRLNTNMHEECLKIDKECRVLTVHGSDDEIIPVGDALEFAKIIPNHELKIVQGANHCYTQHITELVPIVVNFIKTTI
ncbi:hypothetical protein ACFE04_018803 [Oxalis oulophora]